MDRVFKTDLIMLSNGQIVFRYTDSKDADCGSLHSANQQNHLDWSKHKNEQEKQLVSGKCK